MGKNRNIPIGRGCILEGTVNQFFHLGVIFLFFKIMGWDSQRAHETQLMINVAEKSAIMSVFRDTLFSCKMLNIFKPLISK